MKYSVVVKKDDGTNVGTANINDETHTVEISFKDRQIAREVCDRINEGEVPFFKISIE